MTYSVLWTLLPNGIDPTRRVARLSLVASPRTIITHKAVGDSPLYAWPAIAAALTDIRIKEANVKTPPVPATIVSPRPELALWQAIFPPTTPAVAFDKSDAPVFLAMENAYSVAAGVSLVEGMYEAVLRTAPSERLTRAHPVVEQLASLATQTAESAVANAPMAPLAAITRRLRGAARARTGAAAATPGLATQAIRAFDEADIHQVIGMLMDHPALTRRLGLCIDLEIPLFSGERILRAVDANGVPLNGPMALPQPWSHTVCDPAARRFVMKTQPQAPEGATEIVHGMLDLRPEQPTTKYTLTDMDLLSAALQLNAMADRLARSATAEPGSLPGRRNGGLTVAQAERATRTLKHVVSRSARFDTPTNEIDGAPVLFADDVTTGYRVDVSQDGGPFRSLMRRVVSYRIGNSKVPFVVTDEGKVEAGSAVEEIGADGTPQLVVGEELFAWNDWSLVAPRPGPVARDDGATNVGTDVVTAGMLPGLPLRIDVKAEPGTLPRLRFGSTYQVRVRAVDLAGNTVDPQTCDPALVSPPLRYRRLERAGAPLVVPRKAFGRGESHLRLIVRSDGDGTPLDLLCERHILPPAVAHDVAALHGVFDAALGPDTPARAAARQALLRIAKRQDGTLHDPMVIGPDGTTVPAAGITVARLDPAAKEPPLASLPLARGATLPPGQYVHHDTEQMLVPYLADPAVSGAAFRGLPPVGSLPSKAPVIVPFGTTPWPDPQPFRLIARAGTSAATAITKGGNGRMALTITVSPAQEIVTTMSAALTAAAVQQMDPHGLVPVDTAMQGTVPLFSQSQHLTLLHAVQKPLEAPTMVLTTIERPNTGNTWVHLAGSTTAHRASTSRVEIEATWTEIVDDGKGHVAFEPRRAIVGAVTCDDAAATKTFDIKQQFGDARRRIVTYTPVGTTRFTDCFPVPEPGQERTLQRVGSGQAVDILSTHRPPPPDVHSCIPIFRWSRLLSGGIYHSTRRCSGVRVYLRPKWFVTGEGEALGVVLHSSAATAATMQSSADADLFTRWGKDPYQAVGDMNAGALRADMISNRSGTMQFHDLPGASTDQTAPVFTVVSVPVAFDAARGLWYADIEFVEQFTHFDHDWPFIRFGLVRIQPGTVSTNPGEPPRHVSSVVLTDFVQLGNTRTLTASLVAPNTVTITLGPIFPATPVPVVCTARWQHRILDPLASSAPDIVENGNNLTILTPPSGQALRQGAVHESPITVSAELFRAGRIVVEESQNGFLIGTRDSVLPRIVYRDIIECSVFDRADGPIV